MLAAIGDLVEDIVVHLGGPINAATDTDATIERRRGGSAANVAAAAAGITGSARFLGRVGDDRIGSVLLEDLSLRGVDVSMVRRGGRTGSIVVLVDTFGERSFLTDPGAARDLADPCAEWLDGVDVLHLPFYSLAGGAIAETANCLAAWAHQRGIAVSVDLASVSVIDTVGVAAVRRRIEGVGADVVFANADEAAAVAIDDSLARVATFVKRGPGAATVHIPDAASIDVPAFVLPGTVDTTGAGDAFAAGVLSTPQWRSDPIEACRRGHRAAAAVLHARLGAAGDQ